MRILLITPRFYPETFTITRIAKGLVDKGHTVTVLTGIPNYGMWKIYDGYENVRTENYCGMRIIRVKERVRKKGVLSLILNYLSIYREYKKTLKRLPCDYDIVFSHVISPIFAIDYVGKYCRKNQIPHFHYGLDIWPESLIATGYARRISPLFLLMKKYSKKKYESCDLISFASPSVESYLRNYLKVTVPFKHIYQPCLTALPNLDEVIHHEYKKDGKIHILFCGTIAKFNHLQLIIEALAGFKESFIFDVVGSGSEETAIRNLTHKLRLEDTVIFHGRVTSQETVAFYKNADILFVPLFWNSATSNMIPQKLIEYFMYARPIFGMLKGDGMELLQKASSLNYVADQTSEALASALKKIEAESESTLAKCGLENRTFFEQTKSFSLDFTCDEIEKTLLDLVENSKASGTFKSHS